MTAGPNFVEMLLLFDKYIDKLVEKKQSDNTSSSSSKKFLHRSNIILTRGRVGLQIVSEQAIMG